MSRLTGVVRRCRKKGSSETRSYRSGTRCHAEAFQSGVVESRRDAAANHNHCISFPPMKPSTLDLRIIPPSDRCYRNGYPTGTFYRNQYTLQNCSCKFHRPTFASIHLSYNVKIGTPSPTSRLSLSSNDRIPKPPRYRTTSHKTSNHRTFSRYPANLRPQHRDFGTNSPKLGRSWF